jgi:hypothetical protein
LFLEEAAILESECFPMVHRSFLSTNEEKVC